MTKAMKRRSWRKSGAAFPVRADFAVVFPRTGADAGKPAKQCLGFRRQPIELDDHEMDDIVGKPFCVDAIDIPGPTRLSVIQDEQRFIRERMKKLN